MASACHANRRASVGIQRERPLIYFVRDGGRDSVRQFELEVYKVVRANQIGGRDVPLQLRHGRFEGRHTRRQGL